MTFNSYAKINIGLEIVDKRLDGYHEIETLFQQISLKDIIDIQVSENSDITLSCADDECPENKSNLAFKAASALQKTCKTEKGCRIHITKKIPIGAGLGGGSSNAAATLVVLNELWNCNLAEPQLSEIAFHLGADVPFFLHGGLCLGEGLGERLTPLSDRPEYAGLLVSPNIQISTKWAYQSVNFSLTKANKISKLKGFVRNVYDFDNWSLLSNDLEKVVFQAYPELEHIVQQLYAAGAFYAQMSGSGSSIYGLFRTHAEASSAQETMQSRFSTYLFFPKYV